MKVTITPPTAALAGTCVIEREPGERAFYGNLHAAGEHVLLAHLKRHLNSLGWDFVKRRMWKDGHMVDECQPYLRERDTRGPRCLAIYNTHFAIRGANDAFNEGKVTLAVVDLGLRLNLGAGSPLPLVTP